MEYRFEKTETAALFTLDGRIDSAGSLTLDQAVKAQLTPEDTVVLFDMAGVPYISSAGIRVFSTVEKIARQRKGHLILFSVQPAVAKVLEITGFNRIFTLCTTKEEAFGRCRLATGPAAAGSRTPVAETARTRISSESFPDHEAILEVTGSGDRGCSINPGPEDLSIRIFNPAEYSAGTGAPGESPAESFSDRGLMVTAGGGIFWKPLWSSDPPEFLIPRADTPRILLNTDFSVASDGQFHEIVVAEPVRPEGFSLVDLLTDIIGHAKAARKDCPPIISILMYAGTGNPAGVLGRDNSRTADAPAPLPAGRTLVSPGICIDTTADLSAYDRDTLEAILCRKAAGTEEQSLFLYMPGIVFDTPPDFTTRDIARVVAATVAREPCSDIVRLSSETLLSRAVLGIRYISRTVQSNRMPVRITGEAPGWNRTYETISRWLHPGCRELELVPLTGGFSGTLVFRVRALDSHGRAMMPLVMKLGEWAAIEPEIRGYADHVRRYIQNNATQIIETERIGDFGGILYNFVGIRGAESRIFSLEDFYLSRPTEEIIPVFETLFHVVLQGWYGQPRKKELALYREYNRFWKYDNIRNYAVSHFGADPKNDEVELPFGLGRSTNPIWFVENVLPGLLPSLFTVYESSVHGDLNMKNVLMDETGNLWLIDFAETRYSHILRDIVKLEAVIKGEMIPVSSREGLEEMVLLDARFLSARSLSDIPVLPDSIGDPAMDKAFRVIRNLRMHADRITPGDDDITQYYIALLPFTLNLLSYISVNEYQKEYGWIAASLICRRLMEMRD